MPRDSNLELSAGPTLPASESQPTVPSTPAPNPNPRCLLVCNGCAESAPTPSERKVLPLNWNLIVPDEIDTMVLSRVVKRCCSTCKCKNEIQKPINVYPHLFMSNQELSGSEEKIIRLCMKEAKEEKFAMNALVSGLLPSLLMLQDDQSSIKESISQYNQLLSPVRRLPAHRIPFILIAQFAISGNGWERDALDVKNGLWVMSHVCASWRNLILGTPTLWSHVSVTGRQPLFAPSILHEVIKRSQSVPLDISFTSQETEASRLLFQLICSQSERWRSLKLFIHPCHWPTLGYNRNNLIQLRSLELNILFSRCGPASIAMGMLDAFAFAPELQKVDLGIRALRQNIHHCIPPPVLQLRQATIVTFGFHLTHSLLHHLPNIIPRSAVKVTVGGIDPCPLQHTIGAHPPTLYPRCETLEIVSESCLLDSFTCPRLVCLLLENITVDEPLSYSLRSFVNRLTSGHTFSTLSVSTALIYSPNLARQLFLTVPFITKLRLTGNPSDGTAATTAACAEYMSRLLTPLQLTVDRTHAYCLPALRTLELSCQAFSPTKSLYRLVHSVVESRVNPPSIYGGQRLSHFSFADHLCRADDDVIALNNRSDLLQRANSAWDS